MRPRQHGRVVCQFVNSSLGEVCEMSAGGMKLITAPSTPALHPDDVVEIQIQGVSGSTVVRCRVVWVGEYQAVSGWSRVFKSLLSGKRQLVGLQFIDLNAVARAIINEIGTTAGMNETIRPDIQRFRQDVA